VNTDWFFISNVCSGIHSAEEKYDSFKQVEPYGGLIRAVRSAFWLMERLFFIAAPTLHHEIPAASD